MLKILIVDDSALARRSVRKMLEDAQYEVVEAHDGLSALELYFTEKPNLILLDVTMRGMDGIEVLKRIRELDAAAIVIIVSADVQSSTREMASEGGAAAFVMKPVQAPELLATVRLALQGAVS
jgi:two-component system chemotaxis response regulator CheY